MYISVYIYIYIYIYKEEADKLVVRVSYLTQSFSQLNKIYKR